MHFVILTSVHQLPDKILERFQDEDFLVKVSPPWVGLKVKRLDGVQKGCEVHLDVKILKWQFKWISRVADFGKNGSEVFFTDDGVQLPCFLKSWRHSHRLIPQDDGTIIVDDVTYNSPFFLLDLLLFPAIYLQFYWRRHIYSSSFEGPV